MKLAFIGLGAMGTGMASNLLKSGAALTVYSRNADKRAAFAAKGAAATNRLEDAARADIIFLSLPDGDVVERVVCGDPGLLPHLAEGRIVVDLSTISHAATLRVADALQKKRVRFRALGERTF
jgi:3-hydroxyisobutyrate dehydrogenase-like beta-hydroxyacid dehydrogenase